MMLATFYINDPASRLYWVYLIGGLLFGCVVFVLQKNDPLKSFSALFSRSLWFSRSSWVDCQWLLLNSLLKLSLLAPLLAAQLSVALWVNGQLYSYLGEGNVFAWGELPVMLLFTLAIFIADDFSRFAVHLLYHRVPLLWRFHAIHHSADALTPLTFYRIHSLELLINSSRSVAVIGFVSGCFMYLFKDDIVLWDILGVNSVVFLFNCLGANLRHSPVWLSYGGFEKFFISPAQHQIHHSAHPLHHNKNMGSTLAIWDYLFGTLLLSQGEKVDAFGVYGNSNTQHFLKQIKGID